MPLDKEKEILCNLAAEKTGEIENLHGSINFQKLIYHFKGPTKDINFNNFIDAAALFEDI